MIQIHASQVTPAIRSLFRTTEPQARRCFAVLDGVPPAGTILVDDLPHPTWGLVQEPFDHSLYLGGKVDPKGFKEAFAALFHEGYVLIGMGPDDPRLQLLPPDPDYDGWTLEFNERPIGEGLDRYISQVPAGCDLVRLDRDLILRTEWGPWDVQAIGGLDNWEKYCSGFALVKADEILSEATVGAPAIGLSEPGVFTQVKHRGKGYGTIVAAKLIQEIEAQGGVTYWNCARQNLASAALGRKLGYRLEKEYRCLAWGISE